MKKDRGERTAVIMSAVDAALSRLTDKERTLILEGGRVYKQRLKSLIGTGIPLTPAIEGQIIDQIGNEMPGFPNAMIKFGSLLIQTPSSSKTKLSD